MILVAFSIAQSTISLLVEFFFIQFALLQTLADNNQMIKTENSINSENFSIVFFFMMNSQILWMVLDNSQPKLRESLATLLKYQKQDPLRVFRTYSVLLVNFDDNFRMDDVNFHMKFNFFTVIFQMSITLILYTRIHLVTNGNITTIPHIAHILRNRLKRLFPSE